MCVIHAHTGVYFGVHITQIFVKMPPHKFAHSVLSCAKKKRSAAEIDTASFCGIFTLICAICFNPKIHKVLTQDNEKVKCKFGSKRQKDETIQNREGVSFVFLKRFCRGV